MSSVLDSLSVHADNPSAFLALNEGNEFFRDDRYDGLCAYRPSGRHLLQFGGPFAHEKERGELLDAFVRHAGRRRIIAVQLQADDAALYASRGFTVNQLGASYAVDLERFTLRGKPFVSLRNKVSRAKRAGLEISEAEGDDCFAELDRIDADWLGGKGKGVKELQFLVGERGGTWQKHRRILVGRIEGKVIGYISYSPVYGTRPGWLHDLSRRVSSAPPGVMEALNVAAIEKMTAEGAAWLHFGFTPFVGLDPANEVEGASRFFSRAVGLLVEHGEKIYPAAAQLEYKEKWAPHVVLPEYIAFQGGLRPGALWRLAKETNAL